MQCPDCENGKRKLVPLVAVSTKDGNRRTEQELRSLAETIQHCQRCNGTGVGQDEQQEWIIQGSEMKAYRLTVDMGLREAAHCVGVLPSVLCDMECGRVKPDLTLLERM